jgi:hypothetical protein
MLRDVAGSGREMGIQDTTRLLQEMGRTYPSRIQIDDLLKHIGLEGARAVQAVRGLFEGGLITAKGSACAGGMPGLELRLTEPGMAVAFGLAGVEGDPRRAIRDLEEQTLHQLHRHRERP